MNKRVTQLLVLEFGVICLKAIFGVQVAITCLAHEVCAAALGWCAAHNTVSICWHIDNKVWLHRQSFNGGV